METINKPRKIENILSEADELLNQYNSWLIEDMEETKRTQLEIYANKLKKLRLKC
jgi:ribosomal protein S17E